jgi:pyridoxal phosphate enzyme (YggS family)
VLSADQIRDNWQRLCENVARAASRSGRPAEAVQVMAVTKTHPVGPIRAALDAGITLLGENRVQEAETKYTEGSADPARIPVAPGGPFALHLVGHLQSNKARRAASLFSCVQSIDKLSTAQRLAHAAAEQGRVVGVCLEANTSGEESKYGYRDTELLLDDLAVMADLVGLDVRGLMTVGPFTDDERRIRGSFTALRLLFDRARETVPALHILSMGMSGDFEIAIEEGSTMVRVGTAIFGARGGN